MASETGTDDTGGEDPTETEAGTTPSAVGTGSPGAKNQTESRVKVDPNGTFEGSAHKHDWWGSDMYVVIYERQVPLSPTGVCVGDITFACSGAPEDGRFIRFESDPDPNVRPNIVFPGTGRMEIKVTVGNVIQPFVIAVSGPGGFTWAKNRLIVDANAKTFALENLNETHTDPPHFRTSGYVFRLENTGTRSLFMGPLHITVTVFRDPSRELPLDPPHPDFWNGQNLKVLFEGRQNLPGTTNAAGTTSPACTRLGATSSGTCGTVPKFPDNHTITIGASKLVITMGWTNNEPYPGKLRFLYCAPGAIACWSTGAEYRPAPLTQDAATQRVYSIDVRPDQWDSPYVKSTAWTFRWEFDGPDGQNMGAFRGYIDWKFELHKMT